MMKAKEKPYINPKTCAGCSVCVENCPMGCLKIEGPKYHGDIHTIACLDPEKCIGCGICAKACPIRAIEMRRGGDGGYMYADAADPRRYGGPDRGIQTNDTQDLIRRASLCGE